MTPTRATERKPKLADERAGRGEPRAESEVLTSSRLAFAVLGLVTLVTFARVFGASFVEYDDDVHVYQNPFFAPISFAQIGELWQHAYKGLYIPLAYTIWGALVPFAHASTATTDSLGRSITLSPGLFHLANVAFHLANAVLVYILALRLTRRPTPALVAALVFAVHPLQVESVAWISELRGLTSGCFGLSALNVFVFSRDLAAREPRRSRVLLAASALLLVAAVLCKPVAVVLPLAALVLDRVALRTEWRGALFTAGAGALFVLPFVWITRSVQLVHEQGTSAWWQRPFVAGDALAFYGYKLIWPFELGVEYGRSPHAALATGWAYLLWLFPVALLVLARRHRAAHANAWLGALLFVACLLPTSGLIPFAFQAHSTVADRYAYLPMLGIGLVAADLVAPVRSVTAARAVLAVVAVLAVRSFDQSGYWTDNVTFLEHTLDVNPDVAFAQNNLGNIAFKEQRLDLAIAHYEKALALEPDHALAQNNLGLALVREGREDEAEPHLKQAVALDPHYYKAYESLGALYLRRQQFADAIIALKAALAIRPSEAKALNDLGIAYAQSDKPAESLDCFQRAVALEPDNPQYRKNLGIALAQAGRAEEAAKYLRP